MSSERERALPPKKSKTTTTEEERRSFCLRFDTTVLFCVIKHPFSGSSPLTSSSFLPWPSNRVTLVPKPGTRKPARRRHATRQPHPTCGASQVARWSSSGATSGADGHEAGAGGSLPAIGPGAGWRLAGHPELARPGGNTRRSSIDRPRPADEDGTPRWPGGLRGPLREESGGVWLCAQPVRLIPLLTGEAQVAAQQLPVANLLAYEDLRRAILQRVGRNPEQHRQRFRSVELGDYGRSFVMAQQLRDACRKWLLAEPRDVEGVIDLVVLEQFVARLPRRTAEWVQCHRPTSLAQAIQLAEDHLSACPGVGEPRPNLSLSLSLPLSLPSPSLSRPVPAPRSRLPVAPRAPPRSGQGQLREGQSDRYPRRGGGPEPTTSPQYSLPSTLLPQGRR